MRIYICMCTYTCMYIYIYLDEYLCIWVDRPYLKWLVARHSWNLLPDYLRGEVHCHDRSLLPIETVAWWMARSVATTSNDWTECSEMTQIAETFQKDSNISTRGRSVFREYFKDYSNRKTWRIEWISVTAKQLFGDLVNKWNSERIIRWLSQLVKRRNS